MEGMEIDSETNEESGKEDDVTTQAKAGKTDEDTKSRKGKREEGSKDRKGGRGKGAKSDEELLQGRRSPRTKKRECDNAGKSDEKAKVYKKRQETKENA